jgi:ubiquinone/menaquinone biosynthesis C-methylase UbiE
MIKIAQNNIQNARLMNVTFELRDILEQGTGIESNSIDIVLMFNILHFPERRLFLKEAARILKIGGKVAIIHWRKDIPTPRGPDIHMRPDKEIILNASEGLDLSYKGNSQILEPYHWGIQLIKEVNK